MLLWQCGTAEDVTNCIVTPVWQRIQLFIKTTYCPLPRIFILVLAWNPMQVPTCTRMYPHTGICPCFWQYWCFAHKWKFACLQNWHIIHFLTLHFYKGDSIHKPECATTSTRQTKIKDCAISFYLESTWCRARSKNHLCKSLWETYPSPRMWRRKVKSKVSVS